MCFSVSVIVVVVPVIQVQITQIVISRTQPQKLQETCNGGSSSSPETVKGADSNVLYSVEVLERNNDWVMVHCVGYSDDKDEWILANSLITLDSSQELASSPGSTQKLGKGPGVTCKDSCMCCVSSLCLE